MKKLLFIIVLALALLTACKSLGNAGFIRVQDLVISEAQAKEIAFTHAGVLEENVGLLRVHLDYDDMKVSYEVDFSSGNTEYDYDIDAMSGDILGFDIDTEYQNRQSIAQGPIQTQNPAVATGSVQEPDTAGASSGTTYGTQTTDSQTPYPTTPQTPVAPQTPTSNSKPTNDLISAASAEQIALNHAGVGSGDVSYLYSEFDLDNGRTLYEVSFYYNRMEYEYDIDAVTGNILSYDQDYD
ncbi:MAG: PepSY domain-containing protein [Lachnospiraceae bacterium]|jgi:uncharacterized membrane protein YkoI|nr:PepSY domain-containing protein [Lachnospiraceae bacterium]